MNGVSAISALLSALCYTIPDLILDERESKKLLAPGLPGKAKKKSASLCGSFFEVNLIIA
jgi:hypothetical protein